VPQHDVLHPLGKESGPPYSSLWPSPFHVNGYIERHGVRHGTAGVVVPPPYVVFPRGWVRDPSAPEADDSAASTRVHLCSALIHCATLVPGERHVDTPSGLLVLNLFGANDVMAPQHSLQHAVMGCIRELVPTVQHDVLTHRSRRATEIGDGGGGGLRGRERWQSREGEGHIVTEGWGQTEAGKGAARIGWWLPPERHFGKLRPGRIQKKK